MKIENNIVQFDAGGTAVVTLPFASQPVNLRFYLEHPLGQTDGQVGPAINCIVSVMDPSMLSTVIRVFTTVPTNADMPPNFIKWIATAPWDQAPWNGEIVHVIEVAVAPGEDPIVIAQSVQEAAKAQVQIQAQEAAQV